MSIMRPSAAVLLILRNGVSGLLVACLALWPPLGTEAQQKPPAQKKESPAVAPVQAKKLYSSKVIDKETGRLWISCTEEQLLRHEELRDYLPALLAKAVSDNEKELISTLEKRIEMHKFIESAGLAAPEHRVVVEKELLESRGRLLEYQKGYLDKLDLFKSRIGIPLATPVKLDAALGKPIQKQLQGYRDFLALVMDLEQKVSAAFEIDKPHLVRPRWHKLLRTHPLLKETQVQKKLLENWTIMEKESDAALDQRLQKYHEQEEALSQKANDLHMSLADDKNGDPKKRQKQLAEVCRQSDQLRFLMEVATLEKSLRAFEKQPWKDGRRKELIFEEIRTRTSEVFLSFVQLVYPVIGEVLQKQHQSWPALPAVHLQGVDLLTAESEKAHRMAVQTLEKRFGVPREKEAKQISKELALRSQLRQLRLLAERYKIQQERFEIAFGSHFASLEHFKDGMKYFAPESEGFQEEQLQFHDQDVAQAKRHLLQTWIEYRIVRLELCRSLGLEPAQLQAPDHKRS